MKPRQFSIWMLIVVATLPAISLADPPSPRPGYSLTIYSSADPANFDPQMYMPNQDSNPYFAAQNPLPGYAVVRDNRPIDLTEGENTLRFSDVATGIDPTTVSFQVAGSQAAVLEQNYEYDLVSADKLLAKYLDKDVVVYRCSVGPNQSSESISGTLLSFDPSNLVLQDSSGKVELISRSAGIQQIELAKSDSGLITKPTLVWKIQSPAAGKSLAQVTYQTSGVTWRADYNITVNSTDDAADIGAWVTILNRSGAAYPDAHLKLVAGDVQRINPPQPMYRMRAGVAFQSVNAAAPAFAEKSFFEYHLYTLGRTTSISNNSTKQIELFAPKLGAAVEKTYVYFGLPEDFRYQIFPNPMMDQNLGVESNKKVEVYLLLKNTEKNGLGIPLPAGRIRVYKADPADNSKEFIGEDVIQHTPKDEDVLITLGNAFDIVGERRQTNFTVNTDGHEMTESFEIKIRNHKTDPVRVIIKENLFRWTNWEITDSSDAWQKQDSRTIHIPVDVPPNGEKTVNYTVKYTW